jgi:hypothetical protein
LRLSDPEITLDVIDNELTHLAVGQLCETAVQQPGYKQCADAPDEGISTTGEPPLDSY